MFLVFAGDNYYPSGGWDDCKGSCGTLVEALRYAANLSSIDWWHIVDTSTLEIVESGRH